MSDKLEEKMQKRKIYKVLVPTRIIDNDNINPYTIQKNNYIKKKLKIVRRKPN